MTETMLARTDQLREGDVISLHGMRLRLENRTEHYRYRDLGDTVRRPYWHFDGVILNLDEFRARAEAEGTDSEPAWILRRVDQDHPGTWCVQGNELATWAVEHFAG